MATPIFPLDTPTMGLFISYLCAKGYAASTIRTTVSAIAFYHKINNYPDPAAAFLIVKLLQGMSNLRPSPEKRIA
jgi:hypothetical protein